MKGSFATRVAGSADLYKVSVISILNLLLHFFDNMEV